MKKQKAFEHKTLAIISNEVKEVNQEDGSVERTIEGYASTFGNMDSYGDVVEAGAFAKTLNEKERGRKVKFLYQHNPYEPIGIPLEIREDEKGLYFKAKFADTQRAKEAYDLAKMGALDGFSIGFRTVKAEEMENGTRKLLEIELGEISLVTFEANTKAKVTDVKSVKGHAMLISSLMQLGHSQEEAVNAIKELSLSDQEPCDNAHSDKKADDAPTLEEAGGSEQSRKMQEILHSMRNLKTTLIKGA